MAGEILLPRLTIALTGRPLSRQYLLALGGRPPCIAWLQTVALGRECWAVDCGADVFRQAEIPPACLIGDADSASPAAWKWCAGQGAAVWRHPTKKDLTDTQLALKLLDEKKAPAAILTGAFGGRWDHTHSIVFSAAHAVCNCFLADEREVLFFLKGESAAHVVCKVIPRAISLLSVTETTEGVTLHGTYWPLEAATLRSSHPYAVSNALKSGEESFDVSIEAGILAVYMNLKVPF